MSIHVLGAGPSLPSVDVSALDGEIVGANHGALYAGRGWGIVSDERWIDAFGKRALAIPGMAWVYLRMSQSYVVPAGWQVLEPTKEWTKRMRDGLRMAGNTGIPALNLAAILEPSGPIHLYGFDLTGAEDGRTANFHDEYAPRWRQSSRVYEDFLVHWREYVPEEVKARCLVHGPSRLDEAGFVVTEGARV